MAGPDFSFHAASNKVADFGIWNVALSSIPTAELQSLANHPTQ